MTLFEADRPLRVVVFFSGSASGFRYLKDYDPNYGEKYEIVGGFTSDPSCAGVTTLESEGIDVLARDIRGYYEQQHADPGDMDVREAYDEITADRIADFEPDLLVLSGYMWILTDPVVGTYPTLNVHPADLSITDAAGDRVYVGADAVYDAIVDGRERTHSTVHFVTPDIDEGPLLVRSKPHPVSRDLVSTLQEFDEQDALRKYVDAHQEWMKWEGDGPALATSLELIADGRVDLDGSTATIDGDPGPYNLD